jgi:hypothetical protein
METARMVVFIGALMFIAGWSVVLFRPDADGWPVFFSVFTVVSGTVALLRGAASWRNQRRSSKKLNRSKPASLTTEGVQNLNATSSEPKTSE